MLCLLLYRPALMCSSIPVNTVGTVSTWESLEGRCCFFPLMQQQRMHDKSPVLHTHALYHIFLHCREVSLVAFTWWSVFCKLPPSLELLFYSKHIFECLHMKKAGLQQIMYNVMCWKKKVWWVHTCINMPLSSVTVFR